MAAVVTKPSLTIKRRFKASPAQVFAAWTDPEKMSRWMGPANVTVPLVECDLRAGGRYRIIMRNADGAEHDVSGVYREIVPHEKLVFTWTWRHAADTETLVTLTFKPDGDGTLMTLHHEQFGDEDMRARHNAGWSGTLEKLEKFLA